MKISILLPDLRGGGVERIRIVLAHEFARAGHAVEFVLMQARGELMEEAEASFPVVDLATRRARSLPLALTRYLRRRRPDALLAGMWPLTGIAGLVTRLPGCRVRLVASEHTDFRKKQSLKRYERWLLKRFGSFWYKSSDSVVAISAGVRDSLHEIASLPPERVTVIYNPVRSFPIEELTSQDRIRFGGWLGGETRLIAIGNLSEAKGFDVLLRALANVREREDAKLLILGDGPLRDDLLKLATDLEIINNVWLPGFKSNVYGFLKNANIFVLSSAWEGFGNVILEALSAGVPVVSTNCDSGPAEILEGGRYGILVPVGDHNALANAIMQTKCSSLNSDELIRRSRDFDPKIQADRYLKLMLPQSHRSK